MSRQPSPRKDDPRTSSGIRTARCRKDPVGPSGAPTTFFLATEEMLSKRRGDSDNEGHDSTFGIRSIPDAAEEGKQPQDIIDPIAHTPEEDGGRRRSTLRACTKPRDGSVEDSVLGKDTVSESPPLGFPRLPSALPSVSSFSQDSQSFNRSLPSSPKSSSSRFGRPSDEDSMYDGGSQALASSEDEGGIDQQHIPDYAPQLIMPSIQMPVRRPVTERGKNVGRLKILVAGDSGLGKTSLIRSIVQLCEDIVHVEPVASLTSSTNNLSNIMGKSRLAKTSYLATAEVNEVWASTKAYPSWWTNLEESKILRRRKSVDDPILERNICFVDTPGYGRGLSITEGIQNVISYIEQQLPRSFSTAAGNRSELVSMLSGNGGTQVDVVLYLIGKEIKPADLDFLQRLSQITNVVPLLAQSDTFESEHLDVLKQSLSDELGELGIPCFTFTTNDPSKPPYAVCSAPSNDEDNMDASLLMSSDYIQPLLPSELGIVIDQLLDKNNIARLRHLSAMKLIQSKAAMKLMTNSTVMLGSSIGATQPTPSLTGSQILASNTLQPSLNSHLRFAEYTRQEEKLAKIRLAKWANDLRRSMRDERLQIERLHQAERTTWLSRRLEECNRGAPSPREKNMIRSELASCPSPLSFTSTGDPLGLLRCDAYLRLHGLRIFQVVGTFGIFGAVAMWAVKNWEGWTWTWGEYKNWGC
ncbi:MAG: hypothetical protein Q9184_002271 [Pyrenodesmia sp. 2 TL-2023]